MRILTLATCTLNQWAMDFEGNYQRILKSIDMAKKKGAIYRLGPELEVTGYGCQDHFYEIDTFEHSWEVLACLLNNSICQDIICDVGMPIFYKNVAFNCRVLFYNKKILFIRPKLYMCNDGNYRESRWFAPWNREKFVDVFYLPEIITNITGQKSSFFGDAVLTSFDACFGTEICEELWTSDSPNVQMSLDGVEIITNSSGSLFELRKSHVIVNLIKNVTFKNGGIYMYSNQRGCDGDRLYYNGCSCIAMNGSILVQGSQFSLEDVEVLTATVDLDDISAYRNSLRSRTMKVCSIAPYPRCNNLEIYLTFPQNQSSTSEIKASDDQSKTSMFRMEKPPPVVTPPITEWIYFSPEEEISKAPALWLWDYLRRSGQGGYFLPLSGGLDSASVACIVYSLCNMLCQAVNDDNNELVQNDLKRIINTKALPHPLEPRWVCGQLFVSCYISSANSSIQTRTRASDFAYQIGSYHLGGCDSSLIHPAHVIDVSIDTAVKCIVETFVKVTGIQRAPLFKSSSIYKKPFFYVKPHLPPDLEFSIKERKQEKEMQGKKDNLEYDESTGELIDPREDLALQNVQARMRMVLSYFFAQLVCWARGKPGSLLVLGSSNVDECLRGYMTKYDCSSADLNPIGGISKLDLKLFLRYCLLKFNLPALTPILEAKPTAELCPLDSQGSVVQTDEEEMGMTYEELSIYGKLRKQKFCGPCTMFTKLLQLWGHLYSARQIAQKVKHFFIYYSINRHKMTVLTPAFYAESYSPDDNRFDQRQFLYNVKWIWQFRSIDQMVRIFVGYGIITTAKSHMGYNNLS